MADRLFIEIIAQDVSTALSNANSIAGSTPAGDHQDTAETHRGSRHPAAANDLQHHCADQDGPERRRKRQHHHIGEYQVFQRIPRRTRLFEKRGRNVIRGGWSVPARPFRISHGVSMHSAKKVRASATTKTGNSVDICFTMANMVVSVVTAASIHRIPRTLFSFGS